MTESREGVILATPAAPDALPTRIAGRIPSLDGLRAIAIVMVFLSHIAGGRYLLPGLPVGHFPYRLTLGLLGVRIFFVISGLLITTLLLQERQKTGSIDLKQFYVRRSLRILPASYVFLLAMAVAAKVGGLPIPGESFLASFFYFRNYRGSDWYTGHLWSLSVEEQFYLLWPALVAFLGRRALFVGLASLPAAAIFRMYRSGGTFECNMDSLACGCILAYCWDWLSRNERWQSFLRSPLFWLVPFAVFVSNKLYLLGGVWLAWGTILANVLITIAVERFIRYHQKGFARLLNMRVATTIGVLSYSLYLWQQPWLLQGGATEALVQTFPVNVLCAFCCAVLSYTLVERPFLRLRDRRRTAHRVANEQLAP